MTDRALTRRALAGGVASAMTATVARAEARGFRAAGVEAVRRIFDRLLEEGQHPGGQLAVCREGEPAFDLFGGVMRPGGPAVSASTLYQIRSTTKALTAMVMMQAFERGRFRYEDPVARHWPEFAANGKEAVTIAHVMSHQAGIPDGPPVPAALMGDRAGIALAVAAMRPIWSPGTENGYHAATIGWICDELLHRWEGRGAAELLQRDILAPLGVTDLSIGLARDRFDRMAPMSVEDDVRAGQGQRAQFSDFLNSPGGIVLPLAWVSGVANATSLARVLSLPAMRGEVAGLRYFTSETQALVTAPTNPAGRIDRRLLAPIRWGLGFILGSTPGIYGTRQRPSSIGHSGGGANVAWGDPETRISVAFLCNRMLRERDATERNRRLADAIYGALA